MLPSLRTYLHNATRFQKIATIVTILGFIFLTGAQLVPDIIVKGAPWYDIRAYVTLADALSAIGTSEKTLLVLGDVSVTADTELKSTTHVWYLASGKFTIASGKVLTHNASITAGNHLIWVGPGTIVPPKVKLNLAWLGGLTEAVALLGSSPCNIEVTGQYVQSADVTTPATMGFSFITGAYVSVSSSYTWTLNGYIDGKPGCFQGDGAVVPSSLQVVRSDYWPSLTKCVADISTNVRGVKVDSPQVISGNLTIPDTLSLEVSSSGVLQPAGGTTLTINRLTAGLYPIFNGAGTVVLGASTPFVPVTWFSYTGVSDTTAINNAIQAAPSGGIVQLSAKTYTITSNILVDENKSLLGYGLASSSRAASKIDASGVTGTAITIGGGLTGDRIQQQRVEGFWLYGGNESGASTATIGIDVASYSSQVVFRDIRVSGFTAAQDGTGTSVGISVGNTSTFSVSFENCVITGNDIGVYLGSYSQQTNFIFGKIYNNYTKGVDCLDTGAIGFYGTQLEKNGKIADTTGSLFLRGVQAATLASVYNEQNSTWPGAAVVVQGGVTLGYTSNVQILGSRFIGNSTATKGIIIKTATDVVINSYVINYTTANISYEPSANVGAINNVRVIQSFSSTNYLYAGLPMPTNPLVNSWFEKWFADGYPVGWTQLNGTLTRETTTGKLGTYCAKLVGTGAVTTEVSISQTMSPVGLGEASSQGGVSVMAYVWAPTTNTVTSYITVGGRSTPITKYDGWQWIRVGIIPANYTSISVAAKLCLSTATAQATDELYIGYIGVFPGWEIPDGPIGQVDTASYGQLVWDPSGTDADGGGETSGAITCTGAVLGDSVIVMAPYDLNGVLATGYVSATNVCRIRLQNETGGATSLASGTWRVKAIKN